MKCGCTIQRPACARGYDLFTTFIESQRLVQIAPVGNKEKEWKNYTDAYHAYRNHIDRCREGDMKVWKGDGTWRLEQRRNAQWVPRYRATEEQGLRLWLKEQGFWRYAQIDEGLPQDRVTGYYHQRVLSPQLSDDGVSASPRPLHRRTDNALSKLERDTKTKIALFIALLVARFSQPLTIVDRLQIQRSVLNLFCSHGLTQIDNSSGTQIVAFIDETIDVCQMLEQLRATTGDVEE